MKKDNNYFSWLTAYIDSTQIEKVKQELSSQAAYAEIEAYIPTVKVLTKTFKSEDYFEEVPLLFNYGFFRVPRKFAVHARFLDEMKENISCIYAWVKDPAKVIKRKPKLRLDAKSVYSENEIMVATATSKEISRLIKESFNHSAHSPEDLAKVEPGQYITLRGYPWDGVKAKIVELNTDKKKIKVEINIFDQLREVMVAYDNVFFTIYHNKNFDDSVSVRNTLDAMGDYGAINKQTFKNYRDETK